MAASAAADSSHAARVRKAAHDVIMAMTIDPARLAAMQRDDDDNNDKVRPSSAAAAAAAAANAAAERIRHGSSSSSSASAGSSAGASAGSAPSRSAPSQGWEALLPSQLRQDRPPGAATGGFIRKQ
jgi:hypothetical protein